jgi:hypothetical protein
LPNAFTVANAGSNTSGLQHSDKFKKRLKALTKTNLQGLFSASVMDLKFIFSNSILQTNLKGLHYLKLLPEQLII